MVHAAGFEPATPAVWRQCSTTELSVLQMRWLGMMEVQMPVTAAPHRRRTSCKFLQANVQQQKHYNQNEMKWNALINLFSSVGCESIKHRKHNELKMPRWDRLKHLPITETSGSDLIPADKWRHPDQTIPWVHPQTSHRGGDHFPPYPTPQNVAQMPPQK